MDSKSKTVTPSKSNKKRAASADVPGEESIDVVPDKAGGASASNGAAGAAAAAEPAVIPAKKFRLNKKPKVVSPLDPPVLFRAPAALGLFHAPAALGDLIDRNKGLNTHAKRLEYIKQRIVLDQQHSPGHPVYISVGSLHLPRCYLNADTEERPSRDPFVPLLQTFCDERKLKFEIEYFRAYDGAVGAVEDGDAVDINTQYDSIGGLSSSEKKEFIADAEEIEIPIGIIIDAKNE